MTAPRSCAITMAIMGAVVLLVSCSSGSSGSISDRTVPPISTVPEAQPTRTLPRGGSVPPASGSHDSAGTTPSTSSAKITSFEMTTRVTCPLGDPVSVTANYETTGATEVVFVLDGDVVDGSPPLRGTFDLDVPCDGSAHTVVLNAVDDQRRATLASKAILTNVAPIGD